MPRKEGWQPLSFAAEIEVAMEVLERMVSESFARYGVEPAFDYRRVQWSRWFRCADSLSVALVSSKPGVFALGEEIVAPAGEGKRMLALFQISETDDLGMALGRLFLPGSPQRERLRAGRCFARYAVIEDESQRHAAYTALQRWLTKTAELGTEN
jgi:hypothetical protein